MNFLTLRIKTAMMKSGELNKKILTSMINQMGKKKTLQKSNRDWLEILVSKAYLAGIVIV